MISFNEKVYRIIRKIPKGKISTYKAVAKAIGKPLAYRAVGNALNKSPGMAKNLPAGRQAPCHRVIASDGSLGGYANGLKAKARILKKEGVVIENNRINLKKFGHFF
ncbi:MAG: MGMT family protein [Patescibacteria group bacterium]